MSSGTDPSGIEPSAMSEGLRQIAGGQDLSVEETAAIFSELMRGRCGAEQIGALLMGLAVKGETASEICGAAQAMRETAVRVETRRSPVIDTCGTGGSGIPRRNVSTAVALAVAACGVAVAKHGNRAASSRSGSADVLEALGVNVEAAPEVVGRCVDEVGVGFLFARTLHPAMGHAAQVRRALGVRTVFNLLGPLTNPARVKRQVIGVFDPGRCEDMARALGQAGSERVFVVHGFRRGDPMAGLSIEGVAPGIDDLSPEGDSLLLEWSARNGEIQRHILTPERAGLSRFDLETIAGEGPRENAAALRRLLDGEEGGYRMAVLYAGALALLVAGDEPLDALPELAVRVAAALDSGAAKDVLTRLVALSQG